MPGCPQAVSSVVGVGFPRSSVVGMKTLLPGSHRDTHTTADLVRERRDALFGPDQPATRRLRPTTPWPPATADTSAAAAVAAAPAAAQRAEAPAPASEEPASEPPLTDLPPYSDPRYATEEPRAPVRTPAARRTALLPLALQERLDLDRRAVVGLSVLLLLALGYGVQHFWMGRPEPVAVPVAEGTASPSASPSPSPSGTVGAGPGSNAGSAPQPRPAAELVVDVAGKVREPGVHTLPAGARVQDAVRAAGGAVPGTDLTGLNLARPLTDGEEIIVGAAGGAAAAAPGGAPPAGPLSLNAATVQQLDALPGVGPVLAQRIVAFRDQHGGFSSIDQLRQVSGFGERRLQDLRALLRP